MAQPGALLLDGPTRGLAPAIARRILRIAPELRGLGITVPVAEQNLRRTLRIAGCAYPLENGAVAAEGERYELAKDPALRHA